MYSQESTREVQATDSFPVSTWLWDTESIITDKDEMISFFVNKQVNQVFLQINVDVPNSSYEQFIQKAKSHNIEVHALDGAPDWGVSKGNMQRLFEWIEDYQEQALPNERFSGVHLDLEPYLHSSWNSNKRKAILNYQAIVLDAIKQSKNLMLPIAVDIPFWFDEIQFHNKYGKGNLAHWVIKNADSTTLMAYRDQASGQNGIIELVRNEVTFAKNDGKPIMIGVETGKSTEADYVSFYEEGEAYMVNQLRNVRENYNGNVTYAVHHLKSWMEMER